MAGEDKRIRVSADTAPINDIRNSVASLSRELLSFYKENERIWRSGVNNLEKQIRLLEKKNSLERPTQADARTASQTQAQVSSQVTQPFDFDKGGSVEILDDIKTILQQILAKEDKDSTKPPKIDENKVPGDRSKHDDTVQASEIWRRRGRDVTTSVGDSVIGKPTAIGNVVSSLFSTLGSGLMKSNPILGAVSSVIGGVVSGLTEIVGKGLEARAQAEKNSLGLAQLTGRGLNEVTSQASFKEYANSLGLTGSEFAARQADLIRSAGGKGFSVYGNETANVLAMQRITGLDQGSINQLQGSQRFSIGGVGSTTIVGTIEKSLRQAGKPIEEIRATLKEYVETYNSTSQKQLDVMGRFDSKELIGALMAIQQATGAEGKQLRRYQEAFTGQAIATDDVTNALLLRTARRLNPNGTYSDLMADIEKVRSGGDQDFMKSFLGQIRGMSGNKESYRMILKAIFPNLSQNDINEFSNTGNTDMLFEKIKAASGDYNLDTASKMVGIMEANNAYQKTMLERIGEGAIPLVEATNKILDSVNNILLYLNQHGISGAIEQVVLNMEKYIPDFIVEEQRKQREMSEEILKETDLVKRSVMNIGQNIDKLPMI
jgi:hypothetical protein